MTKVKIPPEEKMYDVDGFWLRAACVCVKDDEEAEVLLVSSSAKPDRWIIPGGKVQLNEATEFTAIREALEESGAVGLLGRYLGTFDNTDRRHRTTVYVLHVSHLADDFEEKDRRKRKWFSVDEAQKLLCSFKPMQAKYLVALRQTQKQQQGVANSVAKTSQQQQPQQQN